MINNKEEVIVKAEHLTRSFKVKKNEESIWKRLFSNDYKTINAVNDISFEIKRGEIIGFIGPNGAGKSTTIKMMTGILVPTSGKLEVLGRNPYKYRKENALKIGVVFGQRTQLWWDLPLSDTFKLLKNMYHIPEESFERNVEIFRKSLDVGKFINQPVRQLSLGQRMRGEIAAALLHDPEILFLDEPTIGLDIVAKQQLREFIKEINKSGDVTIILTTHDMKDIESTCQKIIMINNGEVVINTPIRDLKNQFSDTHDIKIIFEEEPTDLVASEGCQIIKNGNTEYVFRICNETINVNAFIAKCFANYKIQDISIQSADIEEIIRKMYKSSENL